MPARLFIRVEFESGATIGPGRAAILQGIERFGSISAASRSVGMTYRQVWATVVAMNKEFEGPVVESRVGGPYSGASLTPLGEKLLQYFQELEHTAGVSCKKHLSRLETLVTASPSGRSATAAQASSRDSDRPVKSRAKPAPVRRRSRNA